jgi:Zn-dependent metalloprotease
MHRRILLFIFLSFSANHIKAQQSLSVAANISISTTSTGNFYYANRNEPPRAIEFKEKTVTASTFITNINNYLNIPAEFTFIEAESNSDKLGMHHRLLQQYYKGIALEGMGYRVHEKDGFVRSVNGKGVRSINLDMQESLREEQAFNLAVKYLNTKDTLFRNSRKLIVSKDFSFMPESFSIAFQFDIDVSLIERWRISIDARTGQVINQVSLVNSCLRENEMPLPPDTGTGMTSYYGTRTIRVEKNGDGSRLYGQTDNGGIITVQDFKRSSVRYLNFGFINWPDFYSSNNIYNDLYQEPAVSVQWATEQAYEYYFNKHNRNSFNNLGGVIKSLVHVDEGMDNAFWTGQVLAFGDGSNNNPLVELDVVGHELSHGVTQYEAGLQYYNEPGALNESFSDILGKAIEFDTFGDTATWQLGRHFRNGGLRDMSNPKLKGQPDTYFGDQWHTGSDDYGGVHYNSGVQNFWFYLLCKGGSGVNDHQFAYSVKPIGMDTAVNIAYRNLTEYLSSASDYLDSRIGSLLAATDLYGKNSDVYKEVDNAWDAVGVIDEPIITSLEFYDITATTVKINGTLEPRGNTVSFYFEYGTTPAYENVSSIYKYNGKIEGVLTGLQSKKKYYFRLVASNENGSSSITSEFTTISLAPMVKIIPSIDVTETSASLYGQVNPNSLLTSYYFEYGTSTSLGLTTPTYVLSDTTEFVNVTLSINSLQSRKTYYYRLVATNDFATLSTTLESFFTAEKPTIDTYTPVTAMVGTEVTITGKNFNSDPSKNLVSFGATRATVMSATATEIKVKVPSGASTGTISLLDSESGLMSESIQEFVPTYTGEFNKGSLQLRARVDNLYIYQTVVEDMDGDDKPDIVASHYQGFSVFQNVNQGGDITNESFVRNTFNAGNTEKISVADFDGNGLKDIVVGRYEGGFRIYPNYSVPGYIFFGTPVDVQGSAYLMDMVYGDFDKDGHIDIASIGDLPGDSVTITIFRNKNPKGFLLANNFEQHNVMVLPYYAYKLNSNDMNNDGNLDLMISAAYHRYIPILKNNNPSANFGFEEVIIQDSTLTDYPWSISYDLNQDGRKDIITYMSKVGILENNSNSSAITIAKPILISDYLGTAVQPGDIDGNGKVDLLIGTTDGGFSFLKNKTEAGENLSASSFELVGHYTSISMSNTTVINVNDLNGDGRPEVISRNNGMAMEVWQNSPDACLLDPSLIKVNLLKSVASIVLPQNTTLDQFQIEYSVAGTDTWNQVSSTTLNLSRGVSYQLRARAKCYLGFSDYYYINFTTDCVDMESFLIIDIGVNNATLYAPDYSSFEIQYSPAGKDQWLTQPWYTYYISNLLPGTTYDLRFHGKCSNVTTEFAYKQFTTQCPQLTSVTTTNIVYNKAQVSWTSNYAGNAILEYSSDNVNWTLIDETLTISSLTPGKQYTVRGRLACTNINSDFKYASFTTPCPKVSMLTVDDITPFSATVNWEDESDTRDYILTFYYLNTAPQRVETALKSFRLDDLNPGTQHSLAVAPQCISNKDFSATSFSTLCYEPFNLTANAVTNTSAELSWNANFSGALYSIDYSISGNNVWLTTTAASNEISLAELRPGTQYDARVHITCLSEAAPYATLHFETTFYEETMFAPNPTDGEITVYPSKDLIGKRFNIHDGIGRIVKEGELLNYTIDFSGFYTGVYFLKIEGEKPMKIIKH